METVQLISEYLQKGNAKKVAEVTKFAIDSGIAPKVILDDGLLKGMAVIGEKFKQHEIFIPDVILAARAMYAGLDLLKPLLAREGVQSMGKIVIGTIQGDLHDIGKNLVAMMLKGSGFDVIDLGNDVPPQKFIDAAEKEHADIIGMSALLTTTMPKMKDVVELAKARQLYGKVKIIVGGAPLSLEFAKEIGADAYGYDAVNAVECAKKFLGKN